MNDFGVSLICTLRLVEIKNDLWDIDFVGILGGYFRAREIIVRSGRSFAGTTTPLRFTRNFMFPLSFHYGSIEFFGYFLTCTPRAEINSRKLFRNVTR